MILSLSIGNLLNRTKGSLNTSPFRKVFIHISFKYMIVTGLKQMNKLVNHNVFKAHNWPFGKLQINRYTLISRVTGTPSAFHISY